MYLFNVNLQTKNIKSCFFFHDNYLNFTKDKMPYTFLFKTFRGKYIELLCREEYILLQLYLLHGSAMHFLIKLVLPIPCSIGT